MSALDITALEQLVRGALEPPLESRDSSLAKMDKRRESSQEFRVTQPLLKDGPADQEAAPSMSIASAPSLASLAMESVKRAERPSAEWIEIVTGLEIKVRRSFRSPRSDAERERLAARFWSVVDRKKGG
jgi:hypothetical protein